MGYDGVGDRLRPLAPAWMQGVGPAIEGQPISMTTMGLPQQTGPLVPFPNDTCPRPNVQTLYEETRKYTAIKITPERFQYGTYGGEFGCLLVFKFRFIFLEGHRRIRRVAINITFSKFWESQSKENTDERMFSAPRPLQVIDIAPEIYVGEWRTEERKVVTRVGVNQFGVEGAIEHTNTVSRMHRAKVEGYKSWSEYGENTKVVWLAEEAKKGQVGIVPMFLGAVLLQCDGGKFQAEIEVKADNGFPNGVLESIVWRGQRKDNPIVFGAVERSSQYVPAKLDEIDLEELVTLKELPSLPQGYS